MTANEFALSGLFDLEVSSMLVMSHAQCMPVAARPSTLAGVEHAGHAVKHARHMVQASMPVSMRMPPCRCSGKTAQTMQIRWPSCVYCLGA